MPPKKQKQDVRFVDMDADMAVKLLGIRNATPKDQKSYPYTDENGNKKKFVMDKNHENRPFSVGLANEYKDQLLRGEFSGQWNSPSTTTNGESCIVDWNGNVVSMAHRGAALFMAEQERRRLMNLADGPESPAQVQLDEYGCNGEIKMPTVLATGVDPLSADTADVGKNRSLADVLFRRESFADDWTESDCKKFSTILSVAVKHVSLRTGGFRIKGAPKLHHPVAIKFLERHPLLRDVCVFVFTEGKGSGDIKRPLDRYQMSLGLIAAHIYLAMYREVNVERYWSGEMAMDRIPKKPLKDSAEEFWTSFGQIDNVGKANTPTAVWTLKVVLDESLRDVKPLDRDALCCVVTRAMSEFLDDQAVKLTTNVLRRGLINAKDEENWVAEFDRFGGLDVERETLKELGLIEDLQIARTSADTWKIGDTAWVNPVNDPEELWYGTINGFSEDGATAIMMVAGPSAEGLTEDQLGPWSVPLEQLCVDKPEFETEEVEEETAA